MKEVGYRKCIDILTTILRNKIPDPAGRGSDKAEAFTGNGATKSFPLANKLLTNVYSVSLNGVENIEFVDYDTVYDNPAEPNSYPAVVFEIAPPSEASIEVSYHIGETWVYQAFPEEEFTGPRISLFHISSREELFALGLRETPTTKATKIVTWLQVDVWAKRGEIYTIDGLKYSGNKLKDWIADKVVDSLTQNRTLLKKQGLENFNLRMGRDIDYEERTGIYRKLLDWEFIHTKEYAG